MFLYRSAKCTIQLIGGIIILLVGPALLWVLGRPTEEQTGEMVVEPDIDSDDLGEDIDQEE